MRDPARRLGALIDEANREPRIPGVAAGLWLDGQAHVVCRGVTSAEHPLPVDGGTLFQIASLTKPFTATAAMALVEEGRLALDQPVAGLVPGFRLARPEWTERVTLEHLLTHTGGWFGDAFFIEAPVPPSLEALSRGFAALPLLFEPGTQWSYNNAGFSLAGHVLERATGRAFPELLRERVLEPAGLARTWLRSDEVVTHRVAVPHVVGSARAHVLRGAGWQPGLELLPSDAPAGGLFSCVDDLLAWARVQLEGGVAAEGRRVLAAETLDAMHGWRRTAGGNEDGVGLAWLLHDLGGTRFSGHTGQTAGYLSEILLHRERGFAWVVLTNAVSDGGLRRRLRDAVLAEALGLVVEEPPPLGAWPVDPAGLEGVYDGPFARLHLGRGAAPGEVMVRHEARPHDPRRWQPPPPPQEHFAFTAAQRLVATRPAAAVGARLDVGPVEAGRVAWIRHGGRIAPRVG